MGRSHIITRIVYFVIVGVGGGRFVPVVISPPARVDAKAMVHLVSYFAAFGELDSFDPAAATVVYKARNSAEQAIRAGTEIADVGAVKLSWIQPPPSEPVATDAPAADAEQQPTQREGEDEEDRDSSWKR